MRTLARWALRRPGLWLGLTALLTLVLGLGLFRLELRTDGAALHPRGEPAVALTARDREVFHDPEQVILLVSSRPGGPAVASPAGLRRLAAVHDAVRLLPAVLGARVRSLASLADPEAAASSLAAVQRYLDEVPDEPGDFAALLGRIRRHPLASGLFLARDGRAAAVYVPLAAGHGREELVAELESWLATQRERGDFALRLTGPVAAEVALGRTVLRDLAWLTPLMAAAVALLLFLSLRTAGAVAIVLAEVAVVLTWTLGAMGWAGAPVTLVTTILPVILLAMAVADEVHYLESLQARLALAPAAAASREGVREAAEETLGELARPIVLTSLTTAVGFFSFPSGTLEPLRQFGLFAGGGILLAMLLSFTLVPALTAALPPSWFRPRRLTRRPPRPGLPFEARLLAGRETPALLAGAALLLLSLPGIARLAVQDSWVDNFDPRSDLVTAERDFNAGLWGSYRFDLVVAARDGGFFRRREGIVALEELAALAERGPRVGGVLSPLVPLRLVGEIVGKPGALSALDPQDLRTLSALGLILRNRLDLDQLVTLDGRAARLRLFVNQADYRRSRALRDYLERRAAPAAAARGLDLHFSGDVPLGLGVVDAIVTNQLRSIAWTLVGVGALLLVAYRSPRKAAVVVIPVAAAAAAVFGALGALGVPLGVASSLFAALSVGAGVDFALHFCHAFERRRGRGEGGPAAATGALAATARAIRWNAVVLALGFLVLTLSALKPNRTLGLLLAAAILAAYAATFLWLPRLVTSRLFPAPREGDPQMSNRGD